MKNKVRNLAEVRDLLVAWDQVRSAIIAGHCCGIHAVVLDDDDSEQVVSGGAYRRDPRAATRAILRASMARSMDVDQDDEDDRPVFQASKM